MAKRKVRLLYVSLGHKYNREEERAFTRICKKLVRDGVLVNDEQCIVDERLYMGDVEREDAFIPLRNTFLIEIASLYIEGDGVIVIQNVQEGETSIYDRTIEHNELVAELLSKTYGRTIDVVSPFKDKTKGEIVRYILDFFGGKNQRSYWYLRNAHACYSPINGKECGHCHACLRKWVALEANGINARSWFVYDPVESPLWKEYYIPRLRSGKYGRKRTREWIRVMQKYNLISLNNTLLESLEEY